MKYYMQEVRRFHGLPSVEKQLAFVKGVTIYSGFIIIIAVRRGLRLLIFNSKWGYCTLEQFKPVNKFIHI